LTEEPAPEIDDPLQGMNEKDRFGLKGLLAILKGPYPDQAAFASGIDISSLGFDLNISESVFYVVIILLIFAEFSP
jgi:hypothetical protein